MRRRSAPGPFGRRRHTAMVIFDDRLLHGLDHRLVPNLHRDHRGSGTLTVASLVQRQLRTVGIGPATGLSIEAEARPGPAAEFSCLSDLGGALLRPLHFV